MEPIAAPNPAAIGFWFPIGSRDEPDGYHGVTHFLEHLIFKGTSSRTSREIALFFDRVGGYINAFTERELMCIMCVAKISSSLLLYLQENRITSKNMYLLKFFPHNQPCT